MYRKCTVSILLALSLKLTSALYGEEKISYDGYIETGWEYENGETYCEIFSKAKLEFKFKLTEYIKGQIDLRANSNKREIELREASALFKYNPDFLIKIGNLKKCFGIEELMSHEEIYTIKKSVINQHLSPFGYVSRDPTIRIYRKYKNEGLPYSYNFQISYNQSYQIIINTRISHHNLWGLSDVGLDGIYQHATSGLKCEYPTQTFAVALNFKKEKSSSYTDIEFFSGLDPIETQLSEFYGEEKNIIFLGTKLLSAYRFNIDNMVVKGIEPIFLFSYLSFDIERLDVNRIESLFGINIYFDSDVRLRLNGDLISSNNRYNRKDRTLIGSWVGVGLQLKW